MSDQANSLPRGGEQPNSPVVLQVLPELVTGGVERGTVDVAAAIVKQGWTAMVVSQGGPMVRELDKVGATHIEMPVKSKNPWVIRRNARQLGRLIKEHGVSLIHARSRAPAWSALRAAKSTGIPFVTTFHGTYSLDRWGFKRRYNQVMTMGDRVIAISRFIANHMVATYDVDPAKIRIVHRGIDLAHFNPGAVSAERMIRLATKWRIPDGAPVVMLPGRLTRWKGQIVLIDALAKLGRDDVRCLLVGSDQGRTAYTQELEERIERRKLSGQVHIIQDCDDVPAAYMMTDVVVSASTDPEAFGRVVAEGQAMGRPVIAPDHGAAPEVLKAGATGWLFPSDDPDALASVLSAALDMPENDREAVAEEAMEHVRTMFSKPVMTERTLYVYKELLFGAPPLETRMDWMASSDDTQPA